MFYRNILKELDNWKNKRGRRPLIIRGARQTGKTVAVGMFAEGFANFIYLNLERESDGLLFEKSRSVQEALQAIELAKGRNISEPDTLLFIDEIQNSPNAMKFLRFFYEDYPNLAVIAAGSLLEAVMRKEGFSFPVGRVEFLYLYPMTFDEFLRASGNDKIRDALCNITVKNGPTPALHNLANDLFNQYSLIGGMPAVVADYVSKKSYKSASSIKEDIITALKDDVSKYARLAESKYIRHVIEYAPYHVGERIKYEKFGQSQYRSREMKQAFEVLEYAMIVQRVYGSYSTALPIHPNFRVSPKVLYLDSGLVVQKLGLTEDMLFKRDLNSIFQGKLAEQVVGQAFVAMDFNKRIVPCFWYRNMPGSTAETDYSFQYRDVVLPVEVKSGKSGSLRSLHQFIFASPADLAIRIYSGELTIEKVTLGEKSFRLLSVPFYLQWMMNKIIDDLRTA